ncbi:MAG TPA: hypothetical protein DEG17_18365 [Cyanobacteria bacterium UBA11149]|nr:hypothetical protein [Cyanobacteria bacterium UBA11367]HBE60495.1 hypothetical protein [Cyanobacteria bacterium UBA11366]HBK62812.1 hypothetical protein [Cyanobacteria bacterium UBA11166]HBR73688.1 hypothetical protein [Cyanobacteria bacterium UBA11159]HBS69784.1 hypothetical protein [Cyanobacteria bacterium UBA11153]HBW90776.1 hypothetical protein [Cyanobacteria bacterium UBA11149]HCA97297.1 hypothetical protein [Cyanobacteria bacterium UBA9226]
MTTLYVNPGTGSDRATGSVNSPFKTITRALQQATRGTTIYLAVGNYNTAGGEKFPLVIPAGVIVLGDEFSKGKGIAIVGTGQYNSQTFASQNITLLLNSQSQLRGVTVTNPGQRGTGVWIESTKPVVSNNTLTKCSREGIFVTGTAKPLIVDNQFIENASSGIFIVRNGKGEILRNLCQKTGYGIAVSDSAAPLVADNKLLDNHTGIFLSRSAKPVMRRNRIENNTNGGLVVTGEAIPDLGNNQDPAGNIFINNGKIDIQNNTSLTLLSVGNQINPVKVSGAIKLDASQINTPVTIPTQFTDLGNHWAAKFIQELINRNYISGFPDGTFRPENSITRAEYGALIAKTFNLPRQVGASSGNFKDIPDNFWAKEAIIKAANMGFITGFPDSTFRPSQNLTRTQAFISIVNGLGLKGGNPNILLAYSDRAQIPSYATEAIATATERNLIVNYPQADILNPMGNITRAEVAALVYQALVSTGEAIAIASPQLVNPHPYIPSFTDIKDHWAGDFIRRLGSLNLVGGFPDGSFKPDVPLNRAQYAAIVVKVFNPTPIRPPVQFIDIPTDFWAGAAIQDAYRGGFLSGFPDQTFQPQQSLRRVELIASLTHGLAFANADENILEIYEDRDTIPTYAKSIIAAATKAGIIVNYPTLTRLEPKRPATRAEATAFLYQALVKRGRLNPIFSPYIVPNT